MSNLQLSAILLQGNGTPAPDGYFFYALTISLGSILAIIIGWGVRNFLAGVKSYMSRTDAVLESMAENLSELKTITQVHEEKHKQHEEDIRELKKYPVKYRK